jgi:hypothetical protein
MYIRLTRPLGFKVSILPRELHGPEYARGLVGVTCGPPGIGKTSMVLAEALAMASDGLRVWFHAADESEENVRRRLTATAKRNDVTSYEVCVTDGMLPLKHQIERRILDRRIDCFIIDSNFGDVRLAHVAEATDCAIHVITNKTEEVDNVRTLRRLARSEARAAGIADVEDSHHFVAGGAIFRMEPMDGIGVVVAQDRPAFCLDDRRRNRALDSIFMSEGLWRADRQSTQWLGFEIARELGLDATNVVIARQIERAIGEWRRIGLLESYTNNDDRRRPRIYLRPAPPRAE